MHPYRPVEDDCYAQDPAGPFVSIARGAVDGADRPLERRPGGSLETEW